jgi:anti-sigma B factor antagonist
MRIKRETWDGVVSLGRLSAKRTNRWEGIFMELGLEVDETHTPYTVLAVKGEVDVYTAPRLREKLVELVSQGRHRIVVDLEGVEFLDSTGLGVLVGGLKRLRSNDGDLGLVCTQSRILKVFEITGLTKVFSIFDSVDAATAH